MTRNKLALEQLRVEKQRLNEENESQARSKSNMKLTILCMAWNNSFIIYMVHTLPVIQELYQQQQERSPVRRVNSMPGTSPMSSSASLYVRLYYCYFMLTVEYYQYCFLLINFYSLLEESCQVSLYQIQKRSFGIAVLSPY